MNHRWKHITTLFFLFTLSFGSNAQEEIIKYEKPYGASAGLKIGNLFQADYKHFFNSEIALNVSTGFFLGDWDGLFTSANVTYHHDTNLENLYWYYGGGLSLRKPKEKSELGMATVFGLETVSNDKWINFFIDIQPTAYLLNPGGPNSGLGALRRQPELIYTVAATMGVRFIFKKY